jgi:CheY-like chemotaxis protein
MAAVTQCGTILVVDDNDHLRELAKTFLETAGYTVITAADGQQGLRLYEERRSSISLVLTDVAMPNINGFELADRVLAMDSHMPVLLISGKVGCAHRELECLAKPFRPAQLIEAVGRVLYANTQSKSASVA